MEREMEGERRRGKRDGGMGLDNRERWVYEREKGERGGEREERELHNYHLRNKHKNLRNCFTFKQ